MGTDDNGPAEESNEVIRFMVSLDPSLRPAGEVR
jgi:hypothetical protein